MYFMDLINSNIIRRLIRDFFSPRKNIESSCMSFFPFFDILTFYSHENYYFGQYLQCFGRKIVSV